MNSVLSRLNPSRVDPNLSLTGRVRCTRTRNQTITLDSGFAPCGAPRNDVSNLRNLVSTPPDQPQDLRNVEPVPTGDRDVNSISLPRRISRETCPFLGAHRAALLAGRTYADGFDGTTHPWP